MGPRRCTRQAAQAAPSCARPELCARSIRCRSRDGMRGGLDGWGSCQDLQLSEPSSSAAAAAPLRTGPAASARAPLLRARTPPPWLLSSCLPNFCVCAFLLAPPPPQPPAPPATAQCTTQPPRRWRNSQETPACRRGTMPPRRAWTCVCYCKSHRSSPSCYPTRAD